MVNSSWPFRWSNPPVNIRNLVIFFRVRSTSWKLKPTSSISPSGHTTQCISSFSFWQRDHTSRYCGRANTYVNHIRLLSHIRMYAMSAICNRPIKRHDRREFLARGRYIAHVGKFHFLIRRCRFFESPPEDMGAFARTR